MARDVENLRAWKEANREKLRAQSRALYARDPEKRRAQSQSYRERHPERWAETLLRYKNTHVLEIRDRKYKSRYGIGLEEYELLLARQGGVCAICRQPETTIHSTGKPRRLAIDHCHESGAVRRLLCGRCNRGLGFFGHDAALLRAAADYCEEH